MRAGDPWVIGAELLVAGALVLSPLIAGFQTAGVRGATVNRWTLGATPAGNVVEGRCDFDLSQGPVRVTVEPWAGLLTVVVRQADGRTLYTADERTAPQGVDLVLALKMQATPRGAKVVVSQSPRGDVVARRLATSPERIAAVEQARQGDGCGQAGLDFPATPRR